MDKKSYKVGTEENKKITKFIGIWFLLFSTFILIFKNGILYSNEEIYTYITDEISSVDCEISGNTYTPLSDAAALQLVLPDIPVNNLYIKFSDSLDESVDFVLRADNVVMDQVIEKSQTVSKGVHKLEIKFEPLSGTVLSIFVNKPLRIDYITLKWRQFNLIQKNFSWIRNVFLIAIVSLILTGLCFKANDKNFVSPSSKVRDSNLELLRIICMLLIIGHHCAVHGGVFNTNQYWNKIFAALFLPVGKICFITFIAISTWFFVDGKFKASRFIKTWGTVFFYSVVFTLVSAYINGGITLGEIFSSLFPISGNSHGFASSYLLFYLLLPFISMGTRNLNKRQARYLLILTFYAQVFAQIIGYVNNYYQSIYSEIGLFIFCYILMLNLKKWPIKMLENKYLLACIAVGIYILLLLSHYSVLFGGSNKVATFIIATNGNESSILNIIAGFAIFFLVKNIQIPQCPFVNKIARYTFAVLLIHDHNYLRKYVWHYFVEVESWYASSYFIIIFMLAIIAIFYVCSVIEYLRMNIIETIILSNFKCKKIITNWDNLLGDTSVKETNGNT